MICERCEQKIRRWSWLVNGVAVMVAFVATDYAIRLEWPLIEPHLIPTTEDVQPGCREPYAPSVTHEAEQRHQQFLTDERMKVDLVVARSTVPTPIPMPEPLWCVLASDFARQGKRHDLAIANYHCNLSIDQELRDLSQ